MFPHCWSEFSEIVVLVFPTWGPYPCGSDREGVVLLVFP